MTRAERQQLRLIEGGMEMLRNAITHGDPHRELDLRARDLLKEIRDLTTPVQQESSR